MSAEESFDQGLWEEEALRVPESVGRGVLFAQLLGQPAFRARVSALLKIERDKSKALAQADLISDSGRFEAVKEQGLIIGLRMALDTLLEVQDVE